MAFRNIPVLIQTDQSDPQVRGQRNTSLMNILYLVGSVGTPLAGFLSWPVSVMFAEVRRSM